MMRIVIVDSTLSGPLIGGAQTFLPKLIKGVVGMGHELHLVTEGSPDARIAGSLEWSGALLHTRLWKRNEFAQQAAPVLAEWINRMNPDVYIISVSPDIGWLVLPYLNPEIATVAIGHTDSDTFYNPAKHYRSFLTKAVGVSQEVCNNYASRAGIKEQDINWIPYGVESRTAPPEINESPYLRLVYVGRLEEEQKRVSDLVVIIKGLVALCINFRFSVIGDGPQMPLLRKELTDEITRGQVILHGWLSGSEVMVELNRSDIFVLVSAYEGFCIALVEAMANGCCPIVTDIKSGNEQLVANNRNGFVLPVGDTEGFVSRIAELASNPQLLLQKQVAAWITGQSYSIPRMVDGYFELFKEAITQARSHPRNADFAFPLMPSCRSTYPLWMRRIKKKFFSK